MQPPNEQRNFVHRRIIGAVGGFIQGGPLGAASGFARGGGGGRSTPVTLQPIPQSRQNCPAGFTRDAAGNCVQTQGAPTPGFRGAVQRLLPGGQTGFQPIPQFGNAVMGQYGAALEPSTMSSTMLKCPRGTVLGTDDLCYNRKDIKNSERKWPRGRRPLLTGGDLRAITQASAAARKIERKTKQLRRLGMLKTPTTRRPRAVAPGHHAHVAHD